MGLIDDLLISLDVLENVISASRPPREDDNLLAALAPCLVQQSQDEGGVTLGEIMPEAPSFELTFVLFDSDGRRVSKTARHISGGGGTYERSRPHSSFMYPIIHFNSRPSWT